MTELFITMNSFKIIEGNENQCIYQLICDIQIIWKLSYLISLRIIVFELFEQWAMLIVFLFLYWLLPNFILKFPKHDWTSNFAVGILYNQSCSSVHLSGCLWCCLDIKETNLDRKWGVWHFNESNITFLL